MPSILLDPPPRRRLDFAYNPLVHSPKPESRSPSMPTLATDYDAILIVGFGGPEGPDDVIPFLENVLRGRNVPRERMMRNALPSTTTISAAKARSTTRSAT